jgi:hypothetical protein
MDLIRDKSIDALMSVVIYFILEFFKKRTIQKDFQNMKSAKVLSVNDFKKINELNYHLFDFIYVTGKIRQQNYFNKYYIKKYSSFNLADLSAAIGAKNKITVNYDIDNLIVYKGRFDSNFNWNPYLSFNDYITVYGRVKWDNYTKKIYLDPLALAQGNKKTFLSPNFVIKSYELFQFIFLINIISKSFSVLTDLFSHWFIQKDVSKLGCSPAGNMNDITCKLCKKYAKNIILMKCNHFSYCFNCFIKEGKKCRVCNVKINDYTVVYFKHS